MGGIGLVHLGTQASLDREVAIKTVRPDKRSFNATVKLLQEAWIAGPLQQPNIVLTYDIGVGGEGEPLTVQERIEARLLGTPRAGSARVSSPDRRSAARTYSATSGPAGRSSRGP